MVTEVYEFLDCGSISIQYSVNGLATISFTVVSTSDVLGSISNRDYTQLTFGGVDFKGFITEVTSAPIPASIPTVFEFHVTLIAIGCAPDCPRGATRP